MLSQTYAGLEVAGDAMTDSCISSRGSRPVTQRSHLTAPGVRRSVGLTDFSVDAAKKQQGVIEELERAIVPAADPSRKHFVDRDNHFLDPKPKRVHGTQGAANT